MSITWRMKVVKQHCLDKNSMPLLHYQMLFDEIESISRYFWFKVIYRYFFEEIFQREFVGYRCSY